MTTNFSIRFATNPIDFDAYNTPKLRENFIMSNLFKSTEINLVYSHYDRFIVGGAQPEDEDLDLETIEPLKTDYFLDRRELGVVNIGDEGMIRVDGEEYSLGYKEAIYIGKGVKKVQFCKTGNNQPLFYMNSAPAHKAYPVKKISQEDAEILELGSPESCNERVIRKLIVQSIVSTCQLQMGITQLAEGSVWNTMPPHVHDRRMETYLYFELPEDHVICHFLGEPQNTRHVWLQNRQAVLSPPWSIHAGSGTSNYSFIWGMAGENLDFTDMDKSERTELR